MAKSLRSKWRRKMRATMRNKNEGRVMKQLKKTLTNEKITMTEDMVKYQAINLMKMEKKKEEEEQQKDVSGTSMEVDKRDKKTMLDSNGQYPEWVNARKAKKLRANRTAKKKGENRKTPKNKQLAW